MKIERFKTFLREHRQPLLNEEAVNKGFVLGQQVRFNSKKSALNSQLSKAKNDLGTAARSADLSEKVDALAEGLQNLATVIGLQVELLQHVMNVAVADVLLSDDVGNAVKKALGQRR